MGYCHCCVVAGMNVAHVTCIAIHVVSCPCVAGIFIHSWLDLSNPFQPFNYTILFNTSNPHTLPTSINIANIMVLNAMRETKQQRIHVSSHPFPVTSNEKAQRESMNAIVVATLVCGGKHAALMWMTDLFMHVLM